MMEWRKEKSEQAFDNVKNGINGIGLERNTIFLHEDSDPGQFIPSSASDVM
jgi:hypothetical protein